jgi:branched-chain amino acid aminotransferase
MIHKLISHNGQLLPVDQARLSPGQEGVINGWGLFTTLRVFEGRPFAFDRHWHRLIRGNQVREGAVRIYMIWNRTGMWHSDEAFSEVDIVITSAALPRYPDVARLALREHGRHAASPLAGTKVISWLNNVWHAREAKLGGFDEVVLLNERGEVSECTAANVFAVRKGEVLTPPLNSGCLAGITREVLLEIAPKAGVPMREAVLVPEDLYTADEIFISSTNRALLAIGEIAGHKFPAAPGPVTRKLGELFAGYVAKSLGLGPERHQATA